MEEMSDPVVPASPGQENSSGQEVLFITSTAGDDDEGAQSCQATRSYECIFCKRGFSNAQALGGHMNIHRKDKLNLNLNLNQPSLSNQIFRAHHHHHHQFPKPTSSPLYCEIPPITTIKPLESKSSTGMFSLEGDEVSRDEAYFGENRQLLFLVETSSHGENQEPPSGRKEGFEQLGPELDLELRLGHDEPQPSNTGMKKFF